MFRTLNIFVITSVESSHVLQNMIRVMRKFPFIHISMISIILLDLTDSIPILTHYIKKSFFSKISQDINCSTLFVTTIRMRYTELKIYKQFFKFIFFLVFVGFFQHQLLFTKHYLKHITYEIMRFCINFEISKCGHQQSQ